MTYESHRVERVSGGSKLPIIEARRRPDQPGWSQGRRRNIRKSFDYASGIATDGVADWLRGVHLFLSIRRRATGWPPLNVEGYADDGRKFTQTNDIDSNQLWTFQTNWYMSDGVTLDFQETRWDDGHTTYLVIVVPSGTMRHSGWSRRMTKPSVQHSRDRGGFPNLPYCSALPESDQRKVDL